ncbi:hypothetical protein ACCC97_12895 [Variovorax sp. Varisp85]|jgi:hypothetical protein|uniref:hypothetical protein n=1 Tax=Variovorax sp. Varisp85 TaxID=3243059 RepID=UPI0039A60C40
MTEPYSEEEEERLDAIEEQLIEKKVPFFLMMKMYAEFLHNCILTGRFSQIAPSKELDLVADNLQQAIAFLGVDGSDDLRKPGRLELWALFRRFEEEQPALAGLSRCAVCCFYEEAGWDPDTRESVTPIPFYLFLLNRFNPDMGLEFLTYAYRYLLDPALG